MFPRNAVMDRKIVKVERIINSPSTSLIYSAEHNSSLKVLRRFSSSVQFVSAIFVCDELRCK